MAQQTWQEAAAEVWELFKETDAKFKETDAKFKETDAKFKETDAKFKETDAKFKEIQAELDRRFKETDARFKETDIRLDKLFQETWTQFKETDRKIDRLEGIFRSQWGKMIEALVQPNALKLFQERGIQVQYVAQRLKSQRNGGSMELDLLLENSHEVVVVEVKSTLRVSDVNDFLADMAHFFEFFPRYRNYRVYGAVAGLDIVEDADRYAYRQGLFVLSVVGEGVAQIKNDKDFRPRDFAQ